MNATEQQTYTLGPWRVVDRPGRGLQVEWGVDEDGDERPVCHLRWTDGLRPVVTARVMADARLIAAAPDLLAACQEFVRKCECGEAQSTRSYRQMKAAIAKAEGKDTP